MALGPIELFMDATMQSAQASKSDKSVGLSLVVFAWLFVLYLASAGPAVYCMNKSGMISSGTFAALDVAYAPAGWLYSCYGPYRDYLDWFGRKAKGR